MGRKISSGGFVLVLLALCSLAPIGSVSAQPARELLPINLVQYGLGMGDWCVWAAQDQGYFAKYGVRLANVTTVTGDPLIVSALMSGQADIAMGSSGSIVPVANGQSDQIVAIAAEDFNPVAILAENSIRDITQLAGKTIALPSKNTSNEAIGTALLDNLVGAGKWTPLYVGGGAYGAALAAGRASAAYVNDPQELAVSGQFHILTRFGTYNKYFNAPVLSNRTWLKSHRDTAVRFLSAFASGCNFINDPKNRKTSIDVLANGARISQAAVSEMYDYHITGPGKGKNPPRDARIDLAGFTNTVNVLKSLNIITNKGFDVRTVIDGSYLEEALKNLR